MRLLLLRPPCKVTFPFFFLNLLDLRFPPSAGGADAGGLGGADTGGAGPGGADVGGADDADADDAGADDDGADDADAGAFFLPHSDQFFHPDNSGNKFLRVELALFLMLPILVSNLFVTLLIPSVNLVEIFAAPPRLFFFLYCLRVLRGIIYITNKINYNKG